MMNTRVNWTKSRLAGIMCISSLVLLSLVLSMPACGSEAAQLPVLLIHGFQPLVGFEPTMLWQSMAERLSGNQIKNREEIVLDEDHTFFFLAGVNRDRRDVFISDYALDREPTIRDIRFYSSRVADETAWITNELETELVDIVAFSMGGLIARAYIEADDFLPVLGEEGFPDYVLSYRGDVHMLVTLATPHHGIAYASLGNWLGPAVRQMTPASPFLALLNRGTSAEEKTPALHSDVIYVTFAGQSCLGCGLRRDEETCLRDCVDEGTLWQGSDGVVLMGSARLAGAENHACISLEHTAMRRHPAICAAVADVLDGRYVSEIIYTTSGFRLDGMQL